MTVGLFGFYGHGNVGDDLMALLFSLKLRDLGHRTVLVNARPGLAAECETKTLPDIDSFVRESDVIIYGGGGILGPHTMEAGSHYSRYRISLLEMLEKAKLWSKPMAAYSIGGIGSHHGSLPGPVQQLIEPQTLDSITLRLEGDKVLFQEWEHPPAAFPDVVLQTSDLIPSSTGADVRAGKGYRIGINTGVRPVDKRLVRIVRILQKTVPGLEVRFFDTFTEDSPVRTRETRSPNEMENVRYGSLEAYIGELQQLDMLFTHKLHVGVAAMSYGIPVVSWAGAAKTHRFLKEAGIGGGVTGGGRRSALLLLLQLLANRGRCPARYRIDSAALATRKEQSARHFAEMEAFLRSFGLS